MMFASKLEELSKTDFADIPLIIFGPFETPVYKVENKYRLRIVIKCRLNKRSRELFATLIKNFTKADSKQVTVSIDLNPSNL